MRFKKKISTKKDKKEEVDSSGLTYDLDHKTVITHKK